MSALLRIAEALTGRGARYRVFEPLLADWQRELLDCQSRGVIARLSASVKGAAAFVGALAYCAVAEGVWIPPLRGVLLSLTGVAAALAVSIAVLLIGPPPLDLPRDLSEPLVQQWVLIWASTIVPPVFLLATFLLRRDSRATLRHAVVVILIAAATMNVVRLSTTTEALRHRYDTFEVSERLYQRALAEYRAGKFRAAFRETTLEERRARYERYRAWLAKLPKDPPPTWSERFAQLSPVILAMIFALSGWVLAGLGPVTVTRGTGWWALVFAAIVAMTRVLSNVIQIPMPRPPQWVIVPLFASMMFMLVIASVRHFNSGVKS